MCRSTISLDAQTIKNGTNNYPPQKKLEKSWQYDYNSRVKRRNQQVFCTQEVETWTVTNSLVKTNYWL